MSRPSEIRAALDELADCPGVPCNKPSCRYYSETDEYTWSCSRPSYSELVAIARNAAEVTLSDALDDPGKVDAIRHALGGGRLALEGGPR